MLNSMARFLIKRQEKCRSSNRMCFLCGPIAPFRTTNLVAGTLGHHLLVANEGKEFLLIHNHVDLTTRHLFDRSSVETMKRHYHSTPLLPKWKRNFSKDLIQMSREKQPNYRQIEEYLAKIEKETNAVLEEKAFFLMVKNYAAQGNVNAAEAAETLVLNWMMKFYQQDRLDKPPNANLFGMLLQAWVKGGHPESGKKCEQLLEKVEQLVEQGSPAFVMDSYLYNTVMKAHAVHGDFKNTQLIFNRCMNAFEQGNESARPDIITWGTLLDACAKSDRDDRWKIAEELFGKMQSSYESGILKELPGTICYNALMNSCAKSNQPTRAEFWLESMFTDYQKGNSSAQPNVDSFSMVLDAWANEGTEEAAERCEKILNRMIKLSLDGTLPVRPNTISYNSVINAFAKSNQPHKAKFWLQEMFADFQNGNSNAQPDITSFNTVLDAWAIAGNPQEARLVFDRMLSEYRKGLKTAKPNFVCCRSLLKAFREAGLANAGEMADDFLEEMHELEVMADDSIHIVAIHCWQRSLSHGHPRAAKRLKELQAVIDGMQSK